MNVTRTNNGKFISKKEKERSENFNSIEKIHHKRETVCDSKATENCLILQSIVHASKVEMSQMMQHTFSLSDVELNIKRHENIVKYMDSLVPYITTKEAKGPLSKAMATKTAASGLGLNHLKLALRRGGLKLVLSEQDEGNKTRRG